MKKSSVAFFLFFLISLSFFTSQADATLSISPGKITMDFVPGFEQDFDGIVRNIGGGTIGVNFFVDGDLRDYITLLTPDKAQVTYGVPYDYSFKIKLPESFEKPGEHIGILWAQQAVEGDIEGGAAVARVQVGLKVIVKVPYPGKYAEMELEIENAEVGEDVIFKVNVENLGKENITNARGQITIKDMENNTISVINTDEKGILRTRTETLTGTWFSDVDPGLYQVEAIVFYDGEEVSVNQIFNLGAPLVKITNITSPHIINGTIGKIATFLRSYWNQAIPGAYVELSVWEDKEINAKQMMGEKGDTFTVGAFAEHVKYNYFDTTAGVPLGKYKGHVVLYYLDTNDTMDFDIEVIAKPGPQIDFFLIAVILLIIIGVVVGIFLYRKRGNKPKQMRLG